MAFRKVNLSEENIKDFVGGDGKYLTQSGIYEVILKAVIVEQSPKGSEFLNLWIEHAGQTQPIYQAIRLTNNDGTPNLGEKLFFKMASVCGAINGADISDPTPRNVPIGAEGAEVECMVLEDFTDTPVHIRIQMEYSLYEGKIQQNKIVRNFFRFEDKATAQEIANGTDAGKQYEKELELGGKVSYKNGLTEEDVKAWIADRRSGKKEADKKPAAGFGSQKKFGAKK